MTVPKDALSAAPDPGFQHGTKNSDLQRHVAFFDHDDDGIIWPSDTFVGFRSIGFGVVLSFISAFLIHGTLSWITFGTWVPDPFFRLKVKNMHKAKHGSDSEIYTTTGEFDYKRFSYIFNMYSSEPHTHLTFSEGVRMVRGNRNPFDPFGWGMATFEWLTVYIMLWPADGRIKKEDVRDIFNGSIFYQLSGRKVK